MNDDALARALRCSPLCDRFEAAWQAAGPSGPPRLEDFLGEAPEPDRAALLRELIPLDVYYRRRAGADPQAADYQGRFPALDPAWLAAAVAASHQGEFGWPVPAAASDNPFTDGDTDPQLLPPKPAAQQLQRGEPRPADRPGDRLGHCRLLGELARGGMGVVFQGRDLDLGRDVAVKVLREDHAGSPAALQRFVEEAQIGGQLQHPGVVPVYELGRSAAGRPYFTMKLVQGRTLATLLQARADPVQDRPRFLAIFEQVCQTLAYAHSRGVIHRDLKPLNVMVGAFGEVQVMDWGLAKVLDSPGRGQTPPEAGEPGGIATLRSGAPEAASATGSVLGTPAYMAPEQARGEVGCLDERCDVFGLGAILCEVLTGQPPYGSGPQSEVLGRAQRADLAEASARLDGCGADAELVGLARHCLAPAPADRPRDARVVADAVTVYLAGVQERLRAAEVERAAAQAKATEAEAKARAERKARRQTGVSAAALLALALLAGSGAWWLERQRTAQAAEVARREADTEQALREATQAQQQGQYAEALSALRQAEGRSQGGVVNARLRQRVDELRAALEMVQTLDNIHLGQDAPRTDAVLYDKQRAVTLYRAAFERYGLDPTAGAVAEVAGRLRSCSVQAELRAALLNWALLTPDADERRRLLQVVDEAESDADRAAWGRQVREAVVHGDQAELRRLVAEVSVATLPPAMLAQVGRWLRTAVAPAEAVAWLREAHQQHPGDFWINHELAESLALSQPPQWQEALRYCTAALALRPRSAGAHYNHGVVLAMLDRRPEAIAAFREATRIMPNHAGAHYNLGVVLSALGRPVDAIAAFEEAIRIRPNDDRAHYNRGTLLAEQGQHAKAIAAFDEAIRLQENHAQAHNNRGVVLRHLGRFNDALASLRRAEAISAKDRRWPSPSVQTIRQTERLVDLDRKLPAVRRGEVEPADTAERLEFADLCVRYKRLYVTAARFYREAFADPLAPADDLKAGHRYQAARAAALAGAGQGEDAAQLDEAERTRWLRQAVDWLRADLALWAERLDNATPPARAAVQQALRNWQRDAALAGVRDPEALAVEDREACRQLWAEVATRLTQAQGR